MPRVLKITGCIFGVYTSFTALSVGSHFMNVRHKKWSLQLPNNNATKPLTLSQLNNSLEMEQRKEIEQSIINAFALKANNDDMEIIDDKCKFEDPYGARNGKSAIKTIMFGLPPLITNHKMKDVEIERYSNSFTLKYDQSLTMFGINLSSLPTIIYVEMNDDNTKVTKISDHWFGRPFFKGFGTGYLIRKINGKIGYDWYIRNNASN